MTQGDIRLEQVQALRSVNRNLPLNSAALVNSNEIIHVETLVDPETQKEVVMWDDIIQAFENAVQVRYRTKVIPFLRGKDLRVLDPRRIVAVPNAVLDVLVDNPVTNEGVAPFQHQQLESLSVLPPPSYESTLEVENASSRNALRTPNSFPASGVPPTTVSTAARNSVLSLEAEVLDSYSRMNRPRALPPHALPPARTPQEALDDQTLTAIHRELGIQSTTTNTPVEWDLAQTSISASHGNKNAEVALGDMYRDGKGVPQDYQAAMDWYLKAIEQGDASGQHKVGYLYDRGLGVPQDYTQAIVWYLKAANQGYTASQYNIGALYNDGLGVPQDYRQAMRWYLKAANQGDADSQYKVGLFYSQGRGVPQDYGKAMEWYLKAANQGDADSQYSIGILYRIGQGVPQDYREAMKWYLKAANQGHASSQNNVGVFYGRGREVPLDYGKAMEWFIKAAEQGIAPAQHNIGHYYHFGQGVTQDYTKAALWYQKAADQGDPDAILALEGLRDGPVAIN